MTTPVAELWDEWLDEDILGDWLAMSPFGGAEQEELAKFPTAPLPVVVEVYVATDSWIDITNRVRIADGISIKRGQANEASSPEPGSMTLALDNRDGMFSPRNPTSPLYGLIGRNTPIRVRLEMPELAEDDRVRFVGEVSEWPPRWDVSGKDSTVSITAQGVLRRLGQGNKPLQSPLRSFTVNLPSAGVSPFFVPIPVYAYWPMEDGSTATTIAAGLLGDPAMTYAGERPDFAAIAGFMGSDSILALGSTTSLTGIPTRSPDTLDSFEVWDVQFIMDVPPTPTWTDGTPLLRVSQQAVGTSVAAWEVRYKTGGGGDVQVATLDASGAQLAASATLDLNIDGGQFYVYFRTFPSGSDVIATVEVAIIDDDGALVTQASKDAVFTSVAATRVTQIQVAPNGGAGDLGIGHLMLQYSGALAVDVPTTAYVGEDADQRALRLCIENSVAFNLVGRRFHSQAMGPQAVPSTFLDNLNETFRADDGLLFETRNELGLTLRTLESLYNQDSALELDYEGAGEIAPDLQPTDDDQNVRNKVTVTRKSGDAAGSAATYEDSTSRMGTQPPPAGVGPYEDNVDLNLDPAEDEQLIHHASWRVWVGTWDEARYPVVPINMRALAKHDRWDLIAGAAGLDVGDRLRLANLPVWTGSDGGAVDLMALGFAEVLGPFDWAIGINTVPDGPYQVQQLAGTSPSVLDGRLAGEITAALTAAVDSTATSLTFDPAGSRWATNPMQDTFEGRTVASGWGTPDLGPAWGGSGSAYSVSGGQGIHTETAVDTFINSQLGGGLTPTDVEVRLGGVSPSATPTGDVIEAQVSLRESGSFSAFVNVTVAFATGGTATVRATSSGALSVGPVAIAGITSSQPVSLRAQLIGSRLAVWAWPTSGAEPTTPTFTTEAVDVLAAGNLYIATHSGAAMTTPLSMAFSEAHVLGAGTYPDDFPLDARLGGELVSVSQIVDSGTNQVATVTRSVNGVVKSHPAGELISAEDPIVLAL